jgi:glutathione S-transferase
MVRITAEEHLYFCLLIEGYIHHDGKHALSHYPPKLFTPYPWMTKLFLMTLFKSAIKKMVWEQGLGRHSKEELREIGMKCLESISLLLGNKKYILGDKPCEEDSALFGQLSWMLYCMREDNFFKFETRQKFPNIVDYVERTRQEYWKDWEQMKYKEE